MNEQQYFARDPVSVSRPAFCAFSYRGHALNFETDSGVFSRGGMDTGSSLLLEALPPLSGSLLDLGCGWGALGISIARACPEARVTMVDVNLRAIALAEGNARRNSVTVRCAESDGLAALAGERFDAIVTNPPIRAGKPVVYRLLREAAGALAEDGTLWLVIRKQQGAESCAKYLQTLFADVNRVSREAGYWVLRCAGVLSSETAAQRPYLE